MAKIFSDRILTAIDVGTTKICVIIAHMIDGEHLDIIGVGKAPSDGLRKGVVVDIAKTIQSIKSAVKEAEIMAGFPVETAYIGISGGHIQSRNSRGMIPLKKGEVRVTDIDAVIAAAQAIALPEGQQILHVLPQYFVIDGQEQVVDPLGMSGVRLEVEAHIILGAIASVQNLVKCCEAAGVRVVDIILEQLASADAVLTDDERELGVGIIDIGGGTCDIALYQHGNIRHTMVLPIAGNHFTHDIAVGLRTTIKEAERVKHTHGLVVTDERYQEDLFEVGRVSGNERQILSTNELLAILQPRAREIFTIINSELCAKKMHSFMSSGLVLTGGGALLRGMNTLAQTIFNVPVRIGYPHAHYGITQSLSSPLYATSYGLLVHAHKKHKAAASDSMHGPLATRIVSRMKAWVADFF